MPSAADAVQKSRAQASFNALQAAERDYRERKVRGDLSARQASDYEAYIAQLRRRFAAACAEVDRAANQQGDLVAVCAASPHRAMRAAPIDQAGEQTVDERTSALQRELDASLSEFDEMLLVEQERVKAATPPPSSRASAGASAGASNGDGRGAETGDEGMAEAAAADDEWPGESTAGAATSTGESVPQRTSGDNGRKQGDGRNIPEDIPDGSDDDVVARQLREAAMEETDPELRARLWEEYRRYKRGSR